MVDIGFYQYTKDDIMKCANLAKEVTLGHLLEEKIITEEQYDDLIDHYAIVIVDKFPTFGNRVRTWFGYQKDSMKEMHTYAMVKFMSKTREE